MSSSARLICGPAILAALAAASCPAANSVVWERKDGPFYSRALLWDAAQFTEANLRSMYRQQSQELKGYRAWNVAVFIDRGDATRELYGKLVTEMGYEWWLQLYNKFGLHPLPKAEILSYTDNAVLRLRNDAGTCSEVVLAGNDFIQVHTDSAEFEILEIYYHPIASSYEIESWRRGNDYGLRTRILISERVQRKSIQSPHPEPLSAKTNHRPHPD